jgi:hypothetical protein
MVTWLNRTKLFQSLPENSVGAEIGVWTGRFSRTIIRVVKPCKLYLVDLWARDPDPVREQMYETMTQKTHDYHYQLAMDRMKPWIDAGIALVLRGDSVKMAEAVPDGELDWVYVDADHTEKGCYEDLIAWTPKVKLGGYIMGHDYNTEKFQAVIRAVDRFCRHSGLTLHGLTQERFATYCIRNTPCEI